MNLSANELTFYRLMFMHLLLDFAEITVAKVFARLAKIEHCDELKQSLSLFLHQFIIKEFRKNFIFDLLALLDVTKKEDKIWLRENEKTLKKRSKKMKKVLGMSLEDLNPLASLQSE